MLTHSVLLGPVDINTVNIPHSKTQTPLFHFDGDSIKCALHKTRASHFASWKHMSQSFSHNKHDYVSESDLSACLQFVLHRQKCDLYRDANGCRGGGACVEDRSSLSRVHRNQCEP